MHPAAAVSLWTQSVDEDDSAPDGGWLVPAAAQAVKIVGGRRMCVCVFALNQGLLDSTHPPKPSDSISMTAAANLIYYYYVSIKCIANICLALPIYGLREPGESLIIESTSL